MQNNIKNIREKKGFTQSDMATVVGITVRQYRRIEKGEQDPKTKTSILIAKALSTTVEELFPLLGTEKIIQLNNNIRKEEKASKKLKVTENDLVSQSEVYK